MKSILCLLVIILFSLTNTYQILGAEEPDAVLDVKGDKLSAGTDYYVLSLYPTQGGGLTLAKTGEKRCPVDVILAQSDINRGLPLTFTPVNSENDVITESTDLNIKFSVSPTCVQTPVWTLSNQSSYGQYFITTGGSEGNPGIDTLDNWFKIEKFKIGTYKLVYCSTVCFYCQVKCEDIGIYFDNEDEMRRLALSGAPLGVVFMKANAMAEAKAES